MAAKNSCCSTVTPKREKAGFWSGILYGLLPHTFCIGFIVFTVLGVTLAAGFMRQLLLARSFFYILIGLSLALTTLSATLYLRRVGKLSWAGAQSKWRYLSIMYGTSIGVNVLLFAVIFPAVANLNLVTPVAAAAPASVSSAVAAPAQQVADASVKLAVNIPCTGHAPLITGELKGVAGVKNVSFKAPNVFTVSYDPSRTSVGQMTSLAVFKEYRAVILSQ